ncbi:MAG: carboxylesterase family protein [Lewinellaceae bacterium]|nr:carboxylesterase family protein [Saprospiraceae bacterium]MCB9334427.1 carboxylesterase family protein [Lewinellaceae bacterium]
MSTPRLLLFCFGLVPGFLFAQNQNPGCDGFRYKQDQFQTVKKTTLPYATAISHTGQSITLSMDVYEPDGDTCSQRPVIVMEHGGSFIFGNKSDMAKWCQLLARKGYVAASIQYRLYPIFQLGFPDSTDIMDTAMKAVGDMKAAVRFFREDATTDNMFRADTTHIFIGGYSAGAVAALHAAFLDDADVLPAFLQSILTANGGLNGNSGNAANQSHSSAISAVINMSGGLYRRAWINSEEVPMSSIHGTADATVPYESGLAANLAYLEGSGVLHPQALSVGNWSYLETVPGGGHTDIYDQAQFAAQLGNFWTQTTTLLEYLTCYADSLPVLVSIKQPGDMPSNPKWLIYPNPVIKGQQQVSIQLPEPVRGTISAVVYSLEGKEVIRVKNTLSGTSGIPTAELAPGVYFVRLLDEKGRYVPGVRRLVVQ